MNMLAPLRVGLVGLAHDHVRLLANLPPGTIEIVGVQETNDSLRSDYLQAKGIPSRLGFSRIDEMVDAVRPTVVAAFGPTSQHLEVVEACAPRGVHVVVEKPMAVNLAAAHEIVRVSRKGGIHVLTNYETTWYASTHDMIARSEKGELGQLRKMIFYDGHSGPIGIGISPQFLEWITDPVQNGAGALFDFGCYGANLATRLAGDRTPISITSVATSLEHGASARVDDDSVILVDFGDLQATILGSWKWPIGRKDAELYGESGEIKQYHRSELAMRSVEEPDRVNHVVSPALRFTNVFDQMAALLAGTTQLDPTDLSGLPINLHAMRILEGARISSETGRAVPWESLP